MPSSRGNDLARYDRGRNVRMRLYFSSAAAMEDELSFKAGDRVVVIADSEDSGW